MITRPLEERPTFTLDDDGLSLASTSHTRVGTDERIRCTHTWVIDGIAKLTHPFHCKSHPFGPQDQWNLQLWLRGANVANERNSAFVTINWDDDSNKLGTTCRFDEAIFRYKNQRLGEKHDAVSASVDKPGFGPGRWMPYERLLNPENGFLVDDRLIIVVALRWVVNQACFKKKKKAKTGVMTPLASFRSVAAMEHADVELGSKASGRDFRAHKLVLAAQSAYFAAMFRPGSQFVESKSSFILIDDMDDLCFQAMCHWFYHQSLLFCKTKPPEEDVTGDSKSGVNKNKQVPHPFSWDELFVLYQIAHKYQVPELGAHVLDQLLESINVSGMQRLSSGLPWQTEMKPLWKNTRSW